MIAKLRIPVIRDGREILRSRVSIENTMLLKRIDPTGDHGGGKAPLHAVESTNNSSKLSNNPVEVGELND